MQFLSLQPFVPSGPDFEKSKQLFLALGFTITWDAGDYTGFEKDGCRFILQRYDNQSFAENLMLTVGITNADDWHRELQEKEVVQQFGIRISPPVDQPYGREVNLVDIAGVCWHFVEG